MLRLFKITCKSGYSWMTPMNVTLPEAQVYFGQFPFHVEENDITGKETHDPIIKVEEIAKV